MSRFEIRPIGIRARVETVRARSVGPLGVSLVTALAMTACTLDDRFLAEGIPDASDAADATDATDANTIGDADASTAVATDSGPPGSQPDTGGPPPVRHPDAGPGGCVHVGADGAPDCADTLVSNADFNRNISNWVAGDLGNSKWDPMDSQGAKTSGSLAVTNKIHVDIDGVAVSSAKQCVPITPGAVYLFSTDVFIPSGQTYGYAQMAAWFYPTAHCEDNADQAYSIPSSVDATNHWSTINGSLIAPNTDHSMSFQLQALKPFRSTPFVAKFDAVRVEEQ